MVFRTEKNKNYTVMSNYHLRDKNLSLKSKGLLSLMLSLPDDWDYTLEGLSKINKEGIDAIRTAVNELERFGYIHREQLKTSNGQFSEVEYVIYEKPISGFPISVNPTQINNDKQKTDISLSKDNDIKNRGFEFGKQKPKKLNLYQKCVNCIDDFVNSINEYLLDNRFRLCRNQKLKYSETELHKLRENLINFLELQLDISEGNLYENVWKGKLNKLKLVILDPENFCDMFENISRATCGGYKNFFVVRDDRASTNANRFNGKVDNVDSVDNKPIKLALDENGNPITF